MYKVPDADVGVAADEVGLGDGAHAQLLRHARFGAVQELRHPSLKSRMRVHVCAGGAFAAMMIQTTCRR